MSEVERDCVLSESDYNDAVNNLQFMRQFTNVREPGRRNWTSRTVIDFLERSDLQPLLEEIGLDIRKLDDARLDRAKTALLYWIQFLTGERYDVQFRYDFSVRIRVHFSR